MPVGVYKRKDTTHERFLRDTEKTSSCWLWKGVIGKMGYGKIQFTHRVNGKVKNISAHRYSYQYHVGKIPKDLCVLHKCDNRACVNPDHLWIGDKSDNMKDCARKGRLACWRKGFNASFSGENTNTAKLTWKKVDEIRAKYNPVTNPSRKLGKEYGVNQKMILNIVNLKNWKEENRPNELSK